MDTRPSTGHDRNRIRSTAAMRTIHMEHTNHNSTEAPSGDQSSDCDNQPDMTDTILNYGREVNNTFVIRNKNETAPIFEHEHPPESRYTVTMGDTFGGGGGLNAYEAGFSRAEIAEWRGDGE